MYIYIYIHIYIPIYVATGLRSLSGKLSKFMGCQIAQPRKHIKRLDFSGFKIDLWPLPKKPLK